MLFFGVVIVCSAICLFVVAILGSRNPEPNVWKSRPAVGDIVALLIVTMFFSGAASFLTSLTISFPPSMVQLAAAIVLALVTAGICFLVNIPKRLAAYAAATKTGRVIPFDFPSNRQDDHSEPTDTPHGVYRKAA